MVILKIIAVILIVLSLFITDAVFSKMYQRKVAKNGLQVTVVRMCRKNIPDDLIVHWLGIKIELVWSILSQQRRMDGMSDYTVGGLYLAGGLIAIGVGIWLGLFILHGGMRIHKQEVAKESRAAEAVEESYQQEAVERGLAPTVVEMYREDKQSVKDIAYTLGITAERVYDILGNRNGSTLKIGVLPFLISR